MSETRPKDMQKCTLCDALVDPAILGAVVFLDGACGAGAERRDDFDGITGEKVGADA